MPNFSIYLYTCLFLFLTNVLLLLLAPLSLSLSPSHTGDFSRRLKFMLSRVPGACISRFVSRDVRFAPGYAHARVHVCAHTHGYAQNAHTCEADIKHIHTYARARYGSFSLSFSFSRTHRSFFPPRPEFDKFICLCGAIGSRQQQLAAATTVSPSPPLLSSSSPPTLGKSTMRKRARQRDHR